jgi:hypothetical protein
MKCCWLFLVAGLTVTAPVHARELRVCADPNNMPFSNERQEGFENRVVDIVARELGAEVQYVWWAQRRGNIRETLQQGLCDVIPGIAAGLEMLATTEPYYRSTYRRRCRDRRTGRRDRVGTAGRLFRRPRITAAERPARSIA